MNEQMSLEIIVNKVRTNIVRAIEEIGKQHNISSNLLITIVEQIVKDSKIAAYESILNSIDIDKLIPRVPEENLPMEPTVPENFNFAEEETTIPEDFDFAEEENDQIDE